MTIVAAALLVVAFAAVALVAGVIVVRLYRGDS